MAVAPESFTGEVAIFAFHTVPKGWAACEGQLLSIASYQSLYAIIGTTYGGNGKTNFALPDLRGAAVMGAGANPVLTPRNLGDKTGSNAVALNEFQVGHTHALMSSGQLNPSADKTSGPLPTSNLGALSIKNAGGAMTAEFSYAMSPQSEKFMHPGIISKTGGGQPHENRQPFLALQYCICLVGIHPSQ
jgi:microcystin-dependent protein